MLTGTTTHPLLVAEMFGPTFQGEGPSCGQQALFVRLSRCNLACPGCDTPYTWDTTRYDLREHTTPLASEQVIDWVLAHPTRLIVISGGEPLLQQERLLPLVRTLAGLGRRIEIETNGTLIPAGELLRLVSAFNVSPKLEAFAAPSDAARRLNPAALRTLAACGKAVFKFVVTGLDDLEEIGRLQGEYGLDPVWVMPEGTSSQTILTRSRLLAEEVLARGWNLTSRQHVLLWEDTRGR